MVNFTKRHYEVIAKLLGESFTLGQLEVKLIQAFANDNQNFDKERFIKAVHNAREFANNR